MKKLMLILCAVMFLAGCLTIPPEIAAAIDGNAKTANEFAALYSKLIDCKDAVEVAEFWVVNKCSECSGPDEEKQHQKVKLNANVVRALKLKEWAEKNK